MKKEITNFKNYWETLSEDERKKYINFYKEWDFFDKILENVDKNNENNKNIEEICFEIEDTNELNKINLNIKPNKSTKQESVPENWNKNIDTKNKIKNLKKLHNMFLNLLEKKKNIQQQNIIEIFDNQDIYLLRIQMKEKIKHIYKLKNKLDKEIDELLELDKILDKILAK